MSLIGIILRARKWVQRIPLNLSLRADYKKRWGPLTGLTWNAYMREVRGTLVDQRRTERMRMELKRWEEAGVVHQPIFSWLPSAEDQLPFVCPQCKRVAAEGIPLLVFQTMRVFHSDGTLSSWVYTALTCSVCGLRRPEDSPYIMRDMHDLRTPQTSRCASMEPSYYLRYTVTSKSGQVKHRRQTRHRKTNVLLDTRAEVIRFNESTTTRHPEVFGISDLIVDQVELEYTHPLSRALLPLLYDYEKGRMKKGRW